AETAPTAKAALAFTPNKVELCAFMGLLLLASLFRSRRESTTSLWDTESERGSFAAAQALLSALSAGEVQQPEHASGEATPGQAHRGQGAVGHAVCISPHHVRGRATMPLPPVYKPGQVRDQAVGGRAALVSCMPKEGRNMLLLSTLHHGDVDLAHERRYKKHLVLLHYNANKSRVDNLNKLLAALYQVPLCDLAYECIPKK
ncbi:hypothetical protein GOODEAATRI_023736, partial [Goodea atripinnis]